MIKVAVGLIQAHGSVLVCQRKRSSRYGHKWEFPGGKVEDGETATDCLKRELKEELGIDVVVGTLYHRQQHTYPDSGSFEVLYYTIQRYEGTIENRAFETIRWVPVDQLENTDVLEGNREVVQKIMTETTAVRSNSGQG